MNYFTHAIRYLDRPNFAVGVCVPDWLSVVNRKARVRGKTIQGQIASLSPEETELALGIQKHLDDDRWFHGTEAFYRVTGLIARSFRENLPETDAWRCGFLGHIVMELLLDAILIEQDTSTLDAFYDVIGGVDPKFIQVTVSSLATRDVDDLERFVGLFVKERFIDDYLDDSRLLYRLNQVMKRVSLAPLPEEILSTLTYGRSLVREEVKSLLPEHHFPEQQFLPSS